MEDTVKAVVKFDLIYVNFLIRLFYFILFNVTKIYLYVCLVIFLIESMEHDPETHSIMTPCIMIFEYILFLNLHA